MRYLLCNRIYLICNLFKKRWFVDFWRMSAGARWGQKLNGSSTVLYRDLDWWPGPQKSPIWGNHSVHLLSIYLMVSTNQADPSCFYFRISWILIGGRWFHFFFCPLHLMQGLRSLEHWLLPALNGEDKKNKINIHEILKKKQLGSAWSVDTIRHLLLRL